MDKPVKPSCKQYLCYSGSLGRVHFVLYLMFSRSVSSATLHAILKGKPKRISSVVSDWKYIRFKYCFQVSLISFMFELMKKKICRYVENLKIFEHQAFNIKEKLDTFSYRHSVETYRCLLWVFFQSLHVR